MIRTNQVNKLFFRPLCALLGVTTLLCVQIGQAGPKRGDPPSDPNPFARIRPSKAQPRVAGLPRQPVTKNARQGIHDPQIMKLLVIGINTPQDLAVSPWLEPGYSAITAFLDQIGIPYDYFPSVCRLNVTCSLPVFSTTTGTTATANYYGIVMTVGNLAYCNASGVCQSTLSAADWAAMDAFTAQFGVRTVSYYTWPEARYGLAYAGVSASTTAAAPVPVTLTAGQALAKSTFSYLQANANIPVIGAYMYGATTVAAAGETTTPILTGNFNGTAYTVGAIHTAATGQQYLALTMDNNPSLLHSLVLNYGLFNWVTKGMFLGGRKIYLSPQVDDVFINDDLFDAAIPQSCVPSGFQTDPTFDTSGACPVVRITGTDLQNIANWESTLNSKAQTAGFKVTLGINGIGTVRSGGYQPRNDTLVPNATSLAKSFFWVSHTYDHENLDCYDAVPNSGICTPATQAQSAFEITQNNAAATTLKLGSNYDSTSMITPNVSGLANPNFIAAAAANGLKYLVTDASIAGQAPPSANTGIPNAFNPAVFQIPRYATNIFYNTTTSASNKPGSQTDEFNYFYGPNGISKDGNGNPFFTSNLTYAQITDNQSQNLLYIMLRNYAFPSMFHQSNLFSYSGTNSLLRDTIQATINKFAALSNLPITSLSEAAIGQLLQARMAYNASGVTAAWTPAGPSGTGTAQGSITVTVANPANITMTGVTCPPSGATCETYGGQTIVHINMPNGTPTFTLSSPQ